MNKGIDIIYQDKDLVVFSKPAGLVCNRAESVKQKSLQDIIEEQNLLDISRTDENEEDIWMEFKNRSGLVHRLDKDTSGAIVVARNAKSFFILKNQFIERKVKKEYLALMHGKILPKTGTINLPIKRSVFNRHKFRVNVDGKMAKTEYKVLDRFAKLDKYGEKEIFSLVLVKLKTGRTHQIRVHFTNLGYPLVSDFLYLGRRYFGDIKWCPRIFLHAKYLSFSNPSSGEKMEFEVNLPDDLTEALKKIEKIEDGI